MIDDFSSYTTVLCVKTKDQIAERIINLLVFWQRQTGHQVLCIRSDHGTEFKGELDVWCVAHGVHRQYSAVYTPEQNGRAERANRDEIEGARALLFQRDCPVKFWPFAMEARAYIKNRVPAAGKPCAPLTAMFPGQVPDLSELRVFFCVFAVPAYPSPSQSVGASLTQSVCLEYTLAAAPAPKGGLW